MGGPLVSKSEGFFYIQICQFILNGVTFLGKFILTSFKTIHLNFVGMLALKVILEIVCFDWLIFQKEKLRPRKKEWLSRGHQADVTRSQYFVPHGLTVSIRSLKPQMTNVCDSHVTKIPSPQMHEILPELTSLLGGFLFLYNFVKTKSRKQSWGKKIELSIDQPLSHDAPEGWQGEWAGESMGKTKSEWL